MRQYEHFTPFTGMTILEKSKLVGFLKANAENGNFSDEEITEAIECALKERPSLGGFVLTLKEGNELLGALVVQSTGMGNRHPKYRLSLFAVAHPNRHNGIAKQLIDDALKKTGGDLAIQLEQGRDGIAFFEMLGFKEKYVELRLDR